MQSTATGHELNPQRRFFFIDALRIIAILLMFIYHVNMVFAAEMDWHIKSDSRSNVLMEINYWMAFFRMPLLFFVSGFISCALLDKLQWAAFIRQRFNRLIIPMAIWTFLLVAPQIYFERRLQGIEFNYIDFYRTFLQFQWWPDGNFHWLHLWFIPYLFTYNILSIPVYRYLQRNTPLILNLDTIENKALAVAIFVGIAIIPYTFLSVRYPVTYDLIHDYARHSFYLFFILAGVLTYRFSGFLETIASQRGTYFRFAFASIIVIDIIRWNGWEPQDMLKQWQSHPATYVYIALLNANSWLWVLTLLGYGRRYLNRDSGFLNYLNQAVYPFYILHQTVIVVIGFYVVQTGDDAAFQYVFILIACFSVSGLIYHLYIRPYRYMRKLFGIK